MWLWYVFQYLWCHSRNFVPFLCHVTYRLYIYMAWYALVFWVYGVAQNGMYWGEGGIYLWYIIKVRYTTIWGIYHTKYDMYDAFRVANEVCIDCTSGWRGPLLFSTVHIRVTFKLKWLRLWLQQFIGCYGTILLELQAATLVLPGCTGRTPGRDSDVGLMMLSESHWWPLECLVELTQTMIAAIYRRIWHDTGVYSGMVQW